ncbi:type II RES/Xre toxin-antitoxin system antitoxin [Pseudomonas japonica]|uniref:type II RES/Xre toxin-antitoxin system antitoxin n=1 Tax=Pseudomonas japonica TaxID=256466 RepID=UPI0015E36A73|nr:antitoxin Xre/MbcA/ParS toxin-binding domain-containing protein [Pseudomonas japonica]MBA1245512.1 DUF2384 domain-containing protein [Pseudomonas japonica]MBA1289578.1 DUF2384 domain-containing protein [Pseudomonas japonica]
MDISSRIYHPVPPIRPGLWYSLGIPERGEPLYRALHEGFSVSVLDHLSVAIGVAKNALASYALIPPATLQRRLKSKRFNTEESDRLYRLAQILSAAFELFEGDEVATRHWLSEPVRGLGGRRPIEMARTSAETTAVLDLIGRLEHGVIA